MVTKVIFFTLSLIIFECNECISQNIQNDDRTTKAVQDRGTVQSKDGTQIGYKKIGSGPTPLVIVHGAFNSSEQWLPVAKALANYCTCYVMDRRGRKMSGGFEKHYTFDKEAEDIKAVLDVAVRTPIC